MTNPLKQAARPISGGPGDYDDLLVAIGGAQIVLLGEATHGTGEFYRERARITLRLIRERGFDAVAIEADAPEVERANRYVRRAGPDGSAQAALGNFTRFPRWMWRNAEFCDFIETLRLENAARPAQSRVGVYGVDLYDLYGALDHVRAYARERAPAIRETSDDLARCLAPYRRSTEAYGVASRNPGRSCTAQAAALLRAVQELASADDVEGAEEQFSARRSAEALVAAEAYYRAVDIGPASWNLREHSMTIALASIASHAHGPGRTGKTVFWGHNSHVGSARSTELTARGEVSIADLIRDRVPGSVFSVGFLTRTGAVMAAPAWGRPGQACRFKPAARNTVEATFARAGLNRALILTSDRNVHHLLTEERRQRAIGAVLDPGSDAGYLAARLATQFDAVIFLDETTPVQPLR